MATPHFISKIGIREYVYTATAREVPSAGCARDGVGQLVPVLGRELARASRLGEHHRHAFERVGVAARHGVQVARRLGQTGVVADAVRGQLGGGVLYR